jgi:hypothetical protein
MIACIPSPNAAVCLEKLLLSIALCSRKLLFPVLCSVFSDQRIDILICGDASEHRGLALSIGNMLNRSSAADGNHSLKHDINTIGDALEYFEGSILKGDIRRPRTR